MKARLELALDSPQGAGNGGGTTVPGLAQIVLQMSEDALIGGIDIENASCAQSRLSSWQLSRMLMILAKAPIYLYAQVQVGFIFQKQNRVEQKLIYE